jgi:hypothetical protein
LGNLEIITPPISYYPINVKEEEKDINISVKRNFDIAYLMTYCRQKAAYYLQVRNGNS